MGFRWNRHPPLKIMDSRLKELTLIKASVFNFLSYVYIQEPGKLALKYELWTHLTEFYRWLDVTKLGVLDKSKQIGISWALAIRALWKIYTVPAYNVLEFSKGLTEAQDLLNKTKIVYNNLPEWMKIYTLEPNSTEKFGFKEMESQIQAYPSTESAGIGKTAGWVIHDEADFHDFFEVNLGHTLATVADNPSRQLTVVSTVDKTKPDSYFKRLYKGAMGSGFIEQGTNNFQALFLPYSVRPDRDKAWYDRESLSHQDKPWEMEANYPRSAQESLSPLSVQSCFKKESLDKLWSNVIEPEKRQGFIYILCPPSVGTQYVGGIDVGEGVGLDYSCLTIVGKRGLMSEVCALIYTNTLATDLFAYESDKLCREYFNPLLAVENNSLGVAVTNKLQELNYPNLFSSVAESKKGTNTIITGQEKVGWNTGEKNKQIALIELVQVVNDGSLTTRYKPQIKEMMEFQWVAGRPTATGLTHGDSVISLMLANQMLKRVGGVVKASMWIRGRQVMI